MAQPNYFSRIFGSSPVTPLQKHIDIVVLCVEQLIPYFKCVINSDWDQAAITQAKIVQLKHDADEIKNQLRLHLPASLFMPIDRRDVLEVLEMQDHIANKAKDISVLTLGRKMSLPESISDGYMALLKRCFDATRQAQVAINELDELVVTGFRGDEAIRVQKMIEELHVIEDETDDIQTMLRTDLYKIEQELPPIDVIFLYKLIEWTGGLADSAQSTGNRLQLMLAK